MTSSLRDFFHVVMDLPLRHCNLVWESHPTFDLAALDGQVRAEGVFDARVDAGLGTLGSFFDQVHLVAFQYDAAVRRYGFDIVTVATVVGLITMMIFGLILVSVKRRMAAA